MRDISLENLCCLFENHEKNQKENKKIIHKNYWESFEILRIKSYEKFQKTTEKWKNYLENQKTSKNQI